MNRVCVVTSKSRAYYTIVSRLRRAEIAFESLVPDSDFGQCDVVLTTAEEAPKFGRTAIPLEELDENPGIFKGQVMSRLAEESELMLIGIDPGIRAGLAVFYGRNKLSFSTFNSSAALCTRVGAFAQSVPASRVVVRIGNGNQPAASRLVEMVRRQVPEATIELVDEFRTSVRRAKLRGIQRDQSAAAIIAFRKGEVVVQGLPRTRAQAMPETPG
jgi:hypothetical protein